MRALVFRPPLVLLDEVWSGMDECMVSTVWRCLTEGGGVGGTGSSCDYPLQNDVPWLGENVGRFRISEGCGGGVG